MIYLVKLTLVVEPEAPSMLENSTILYVHKLSKKITKRTQENLFSRYLSHRYGCIEVSQNRYIIYDDDPRRSKDTKNCSYLAPHSICGEKANTVICTPYVSESKVFTEDDGCNDRRYPTEYLVPER